MRKISVVASTIANRRVIGGLLVMAILVFGAFSAVGTTYYVNPGESIQDAIDGASPGDTINVAAGTYAEYLYVTTDDLTIQGAGIDQSIIDLDGLVPYWHYDSSSSYASRAGVLISSYGNSSSGHNMTGGSTELIENVTFTGFTVRNAGVNSPGTEPEYYDQDGDGREDITGIRVGSGKDIIIHGCKVENSGDVGISFGRARKTDAGSRPASENPTVEDCSAISNHDTGINISYSTGIATIRNNTASNNLNLDAPDNHAKGICVAGRSNSLLLEGVVSGNTTTGNRYYGIEIYRYTDGFTVENNTVTGQNLDYDAAGIFVSTGWGTSKICRNHVVQNNVVTGNIRGIITYFATDTTIEGNTVTTDSGAFSQGQAAIKVDNSSGTTVQNNLLGTTGTLEGYGIRVTGESSNSFFTNNTIQGAAFLAVYVSNGGDNNSFIGNTITGATLAAFGISTIGTGNTFTGNTITATPWVWYTNYSVQTVVDLANAGDSVYVAAGSYVEQVAIDEDLVLQGEPGASIKAPGSQTYTIAESSRTWDPIIFAYGGTMVGNHVSGPGVINADVKGLDVDGQNNAQAAPVRFVGILYRNVDGEISGNTIHDLYDADGEGNGPETFGILIYGDSTVNILNNTISDYSRGGIGVQGDLGSAPDPVATVQGNTLIGNGFEAGTNWWADNGIQFGYGASGQIIDNTVTGHWSNSPWGASGIIIVSTENVDIIQNLVQDNELGIALAGYSVYGGNYTATNNILVQENDLTGNEYAISIQMDANNTTIWGNVISGNYSGISTSNYYGVEAVGTEAHYNSIAGNTYGFINWNVLADINATLNWWGAADGPSADLDQDGTWDYVGGGDAIWGNVIFSPWLGIDPDGDPGTVGVQLISPMLFIVDDVGPASTLGYLGSAIDASNTLPGIDSIEVRDGTYDASEPITDGVNIFSAVGTEDTILNGPMSLDVANIIIGLFGQGFTINGPITVGAGIDASTIHINWNDIYGIVTNAGLKVLDATFNYWDTDGPDTVGRVNVYPYLPIPAADIIGYMDEYGFNAMQAITFARLLLKGLPAGWIEIAIEIESTFGISVNDAMALIRGYGLGTVKRALRMATTPDDFLVMLMGYVAGGGGGGSYLGGGAGGGTEISIFCVGCTIPLQIELVHPITGDPITDAVVSYSVCRTLPDGTSEIVMLGVMTYDDGLGAYTFEVDTTGLEPGIYDIYIGTDDGRSRHFQIEIAVY